MQAFLSYLATERDVAASTQNQAMAAPTYRMMDNWRRPSRSRTVSFMALLSGRASTDSLRPDTALISIVKKDIEVAWTIAEKSEQQRKLSPMMDAMIGRVMHQFSQPHDASNHTLAIPQPAHGIRFPRFAGGRRPDGCRAVSYLTKRMRPGSLAQYSRLKITLPRISRGSMGS